MLERLLLKLWYQPTLSPWLYPLLPFSYLYRSIFAINRCLYRWKIKKIYHFPKPVIVVGNLTLGGTGKTPLIIALAHYFTEKNLRVGVITRGYGANLPRPRKVSPTDDAKLVGDEALLIARNIKGVVVACRKRTQAARFLCEHEKIDIILSDDGLQHHALYRQLEICVVDEFRRFGNAQCLPAGPLREPLTRLKTVNLLVTPKIMPLGFYSVKTGQAIDPALLKKPLLALAGIGNPDRFFHLLTTLGLSPHTKSFPDHHVFEAKDLRHLSGEIVIMTEKDAVKCRGFADEDCYFLKVRAELPTSLKEVISCEFLF